MVLLLLPGILCSPLQAFPVPQKGLGTAAQLVFITVFNHFRSPKDSIAGHPNNGRCAPGTTYTSFITSVSPCLNFPIHRPCTGKQQRKGDPWRQTLLLNDKPVHFKLDTGADVTVRRCTNVLVHYRLQQQYCMDLTQNIFL